MAIRRRKKGFVSVLITIWLFPGSLAGSVLVSKLLISKQLNGGSGVCRPVQVGMVKCSDP